MVHKKVRVWTSGRTPVPTPRGDHKCLLWLTLRIPHVHASGEGGRTKEGPQSFLFPANRTTANYIDAGTLNKKLNALTACLWVKPRLIASSFQESFISYAASQKNLEFSLGRLQGYLWVALADNRR